MDVCHIIDELRQNFIELEIENNQDTAEIILESTQPILEQNLSYAVTTELYSIILSCFSLFPESLLPAFDRFFDKSRTNSNYIIITTYIIFKIKQLTPLAKNPKWDSFVDDAINELLPQLENKCTKPLIIFDHEISPLFEKEFIINLLLLSNQKEKICSKCIQPIFSLYFFPQKADKKTVELFESKVLPLFLSYSKSASIQILPQNDESNQQLFEFITKRDPILISTMNSEAFSIIESAVNFAETKKINGFSKENSLQFISVLLIYIGNTKCSNVLILPNNSLIEMITSPDITSPNLNSLCDLIYQNVRQLLNCGVLSINDLDLIYKDLFKKIVEDRLNSNKTIALASLFDFTNLDPREKINLEHIISQDIILVNMIIFNFLKENLNALLQYILTNLSEIINCEELKYHQLNLKTIDIDLINFVTDKISPINISHFIYFIMNFCINTNLISSEKNDQLLSNTIEQLIKEKKYDEIIIILSYFHTKSDIFLKLLSKNRTDPFFEYSLYQQEIKSNDLEKLCEKMMDDKDNIQCFQAFYCCRYQNNFYKKVQLYKYISNLDDKYKKNIDSIINKAFYLYDEKLIRNPEFKLSMLPISKSGSSIVLKLFDIIDNYPNNYQSFIYLKSICNSFPNLFFDLSDRIFNSVLKAFSNFYLIYDNFFNEKVKTVYTAFSFIISTFQTPTIIDKFLNWLFTNITTFDNSQVFGFINVLNCIYTDSLVEIMIQPWILKSNFLDKISSLLDRKLFVGTFNDKYKANIYILLNNIYKGYTKFNALKVIQIDEFMKNIEYPITYLYNDSFLNFLKIKFKSKFSNNKLNEFVDLIEISNDFWIVNNGIDLSYYTHYNHEDIENADELLNNLQSIQIPQNYSNELPSYPNSISIKMARYLLKKPYWVYSWFLFQNHSDIIDPKRHEILVKVIEDLNEIEKNQDKNDDESKNFASFDTSNYFKNQYLQKSLFFNLVRQITNRSVPDSVFESLFKAIQTICQNKESIPIIIELIGEKLSNYSQNKKQIDSFVSVLSLIRNEKGFQEPFLKYCSDILINIVLSPEFRTDLTLLKKLAQIYIVIDNDKIPVRCLQICSFLILNLKDKKDDNNNIIKESLQLCSKFSSNQLGDTGMIIENLLDKEIEKNELTETLKNLIQYYPQTKSIQALNILNILKEKLEKFNKYNERSIDDVIFLLNELAPKRETNLSLSYILNKKDDNSSTIPPEIRDLSPPYWDLFSQHMIKIINLIESNPTLYRKCTFLKQYPEIMNLKTRISIFRKQMSNKRTSGSFQLVVDRQNILTSSFNSMQKYLPYDLLGEMSVRFINEKGADYGGLTNEWFTKLAQEILNANYGLFDCSENKMSYKPNRQSSIANPNDLDYFKFAGKFIALALIHGECINVHFTTAFCKQILHRKPKLKDLQDFDEKLYQSLLWIQENDADQLDFVFEYGIDFFGEYKKIELKENGSQIAVTNDNKNEYIDLLSNFIMCNLIEKQVKSFCDGFNSLISPNEIEMFTPNELDLLICGIPKIDVNDFIQNIHFNEGYNKETPVVKLFFKAISQWTNEDLVKLLLFMTGTSRVPLGGFKEFANLSGHALTIEKGGDRNHLPRARTCFNLLLLPEYETEDELNEKIMMAIHECDTFEFC